MKLLTTLAVAAGLMAASGASFAADADAAQATLKNGACTKCHAVDKKKTGPAFKEVAKKYKGQNVAAQLEGKVKKGGQGVWGPVPMPPNAAVPDADIKKLVDWILKL